MEHADPIRAAVQSWTGARTGLLRQLWNESASSSAIAVALAGVSRSEVIEKLRGMSWPPADHQQPLARTTKSASQDDAHPPLAPGSQSSCPPPAPDLALDQFNAAIPLERRRTLFQLTRSSCRWPVGEPDQSDFFFCGAPAAKGRVYCAGHCEFAYRPEDQIHARTPRSRS